MPKASAHQDRLMETVLTFNVELSVGGIDPDVNELQGTISDALMEYDAAHRLFPGNVRRDGTPALNGTIISLEKTEKRIDRVDQIRRNLGALQKPAYYDATEAACPRATDVSCAVDHHIEDLRAAQARIWDGRDEAMHATDLEQHKAALERMRAGMEECLKLLQKKLPDIPVLG